MNKIISTLKIARFFIKGGYNKPIWGEGLFSDNVTDAINKFRPNADGYQKLKLKIQLTKEYVNRQVTPLEFFLYDFPNRTAQQKDNFLPDQWKDKLSMKATSLQLFKSELTDKYKFYTLNKEFFKRNAMQIDSNTSLDEFESFSKHEGKLFIKPINGSYGRGAFIYNYDAQDIADTFNKLHSSDSTFIAEALIKQSDIMSEWNASSVNTVRVPTILTDKGFYVMGCFMRTGRKGTIIDNAGGGGILAAVDGNTGVVITNGFDEGGHFHKVHPDSKKEYKGFQLPEWDTLLKIAENAHRGMPKHKYIAYDFAHTDNGWVLIEGNWGQFLSQFPTGIGLKDLWFKYMNE